MKNTLPTPPLEVLRDMFVYEPETGLFRRRHNLSLVGGKSAGYIVLWIWGRRHRAHRIAWAMHNSCILPTSYEIDHINGDRLDNRISNLRVATAMQNMWNQKPSSRNVSGTKGVNLDKQTGKWRARIEVDGRSISLGRHDTLELAIAARREGEVKYFGEFAPTA